MANNLVEAITTRDVRELIGQSALTNNYLVYIPPLSTGMVDSNRSKLADHIKKYGRLTDGDSVSKKLGLQIAWKGKGKSQKGINKISKEKFL